MISALCHSADNARIFDFDATPWFREADPGSIVKVAEGGWSSTWIADALESRPGYEGLHELIGYALNRLQVKSLEDPTWSTFECVVNGSEAMSWLRDNRPDIASMIHADAADRGRPGN